MIIANRHTEHESRLKFYDRTPAYVNTFGTAIPVVKCFLIGFPNQRRSAKV